MHFSCLELFCAPRQGSTRAEAIEVPRWWSHEQMLVIYNFNIITYKYCYNVVSRKNLISFSSLVSLIWPPLSGVLYFQDWAPAPVPALGKLWADDEMMNGLWFQVSQLIVVPPVLVAVCKWHDTYDLSSVKTVYSGAAPLHKENLEAVYQK